MYHFSFTSKYHGTLRGFPPICVSIVQSAHSISLAAGYLYFPLRPARNLKRPASQTAGFCFLQLVIAMADGGKGPATPAPNAAASGGGKKITKPRTDDEGTIKVASKKDPKDKSNGVIKLKKPAPKHKLPGNWKDGSIIDRMSAS